MKIYLTLNEEKEKDKLIIDYLNNQYSKSGAIKAMLYQIATNTGNMPIVAIQSKEGEKHQEQAKDSYIGKDAIVVKSSKKIDLSEFI